MKEINKFKDGKRIGFWRLYYYDDKEMSGIYNKSISLISEEGFYKNDEKDGVWKFHDEYGNLKSISIYKDGILKQNKKINNDK